VARCYKDCKHNFCDMFCNKYGERILTSRNPFSYGILLHPLEYLSTFYHRDVNLEISHLIKIAEKFSEDDVSKNIINQYKKNGYISYKQRKFLVYQLLHCFERRER
jgi:hypothetical protein